MEAVVRTERCTGCGGCTHLDRRISMQPSNGFLRPTFHSDRAGGSLRADARRFKQICPGVEVRAQHPPGSVRDPILGPVQGLWVAWAADPEFRFRGSSGGVLSSLASWAVEQGLVERAVGASAGTEPRLTVPVSITTRAEALRSAGSRYAPCSSGGHVDALDPDGLTIAKPCEAYALRRHSNLDQQKPPLLLSFFCAGTPSQDATDETVVSLGLDPRRLADLWYRGRGWPGRFTAVSMEGVEESLGYSESWGSRLGPTVQWRCRTCPDGVGEASDITAGDIWESDGSGHPSFDERPGQSVLIARTELGLDVIQRAIKSGVIIAQLVSSREVIEAQPYQVWRRQRLAGRILGTLAVNGRATRTWGFGSAGWAVSHPRATLAELRGTRVRLQARSAKGIRS